MKEKFYRIVEIEDKAGGKQYYTEYLKWSILGGLLTWWTPFYYFDSIQVLKENYRSCYYAYCNAVNAIKYHKMFGNDSNKKVIHNMSDI